VDILEFFYHVSEKKIYEIKIKIYKIKKLLKCSDKSEVNKRSKLVMLSN